MIKRVISLFLTAVILLLSMAIAVPAANDSGALSPQAQKMLNYLQGDSRKRLLLSDNYGYMTTAEQFYTDLTFMRLIRMCNSMLHTGIKPDKQKYMEVLTNIIASYDLDRADDIAAQKQLDHLKGVREYAYDVAMIGADLVSVSAGLGEAATALQSNIALAVDSLAVLAEHTENYIEAISNLEALIRDYSAHQTFLDQVARGTDDPDLRDAAETLQNILAEAFGVKLETYADISEENFQDYEEFFFSNILFTALKNTPEYASDEMIKFFTDCGDAVVTAAFVFKGSWELGKAIGVLVGDVVTGGENLINRALEMLALFHISNTLEDALIDAQTDFLNHMNADDAMDRIESYVDLSQYLIATRIRGEYCLYSIVANDAGLLSWFRKNTAEEAKRWYDDRADRLCMIQRELLDILNVTEGFVCGKYLVERGGAVYGVDSNGLWKSEDGGAPEYLAQHSSTNLATDGTVVYYGVLADSSKASMGIRRYDMYAYDLKTGSDKKIMSFNECGEPICAVGDLIYYADYTAEEAGDPMAQVERAHSLWSYNQATGERKYITGGASMIHTYEGKIFYRDIMAAIPSGNTHRINCYDTATGQIKEISDPRVRSFKIFAGKVYYNTLTERSGNYSVSVGCYDIGADSAEVLFEKSSSSYIDIEDYDGKYIIYSLGSGKVSSFCRVSVADKEEVTIPLPYAGTASEALRDDDRTIFYTDYYSGRIFTLPDDATDVANSQKNYTWRKLLLLNEDTAFAVSNSGNNFYEYLIECVKIR